MPDRYEQEFGFPVGPWFRWFAWRPVLTEDRGWRWGRVVWRRRCQSHNYLDVPTVHWFQHVCEDPRERESARDVLGDGGWGIR